MTLLADGVDAVLEGSVVGSFTRVGPVLRRRLEHWSPAAPKDLTGRVIVITGGTSGLGLQAARDLGRAGATIAIVARNEGKARSICASLATEIGHDRVSFVTADMGDLEAVRRAADTLRARHPAIHVLIHNAGALDDERHETPQGLEQTVASHVVGPFLLTGLLLPELRAAAPSRVLWVASGGMYSEALRVADLEMPAGRYDGTTAYARAKRAQVALSGLWADRLRSESIFVHAMHPGWADTPGVERSLPRFRRVVGRLLRTPEEGADTLVWLAADDGVPMQETGRFWLDRRPRPIHRLPSTKRSDTPEERARLWDWVSAKSGWSDR